MRATVRRYFRNAPPAHWLDGQRCIGQNLKPNATFLLVDFGDAARLRASKWTAGLICSALKFWRTSECARESCIALVASLEGKRSSRRRQHGRYRLARSRGGAPSCLPAFPLSPQTKTSQPSALQAPCSQSLRDQVHNGLLSIAVARKTSKSPTLLRSSKWVTGSSRKNVPPRLRARPKKNASARSCLWPWLSKWLRYEWGHRRSEQESPKLYRT